MHTSTTKAAPIASFSSLTLKEKIDRVTGLQRQGFYLYAHSPDDKLIGDSVEGTRDEKWAKRTWRDCPDAIPYIITNKFGGAESLAIVFLAPPRSGLADITAELLGLPDTFRVEDSDWVYLLYRVPPGAYCEHLFLPGDASITVGDLISVACIKTCGAVAELPDVLFAKAIKSHLAKRAREAIEFGVNVWETA